MSTLPRILMRAAIRKLKLQSMRQVKISAVDQIYSPYGDLGPAVPFPAFTYGDLGSAAPEMTPDTKATPIPVLLGEKTDYGSVDPITGQPRRKGRLPGVYLGKFAVGGIAIPPASTGRTLAEAVALMQGLVDRDADDAEWESVLGFDIGSSDIVRLKAIGTVPDTYERLAEVIGYADLDQVLAHGTTAAPVDNVWGILSFGIGPFFRWTWIGASDQGHGDPQATPDREGVDIAALSGSQLLVPGYSPCPFNAFSLTNPDTGRTFDLACIGVRGPLLDDHLSGKVNITADAIGLMGANGFPIGYLMDGLHFIKENFFIANKTAGPWLTTSSTEAKWSDGVAKVKSSTYQERQTQMREGIGYDPIISFYADTQAPKTEWMARFSEWTETKFGTDGPGQIVAFGLDTLADISTWPVMRHEVDCYGDVEMDFGEDRENTVQGVCDYDPDASKFVSDVLNERAYVGIAKYRHEKPCDHLIENQLIADTNVLRWLLKQRMARLGLGVKLVTVRCTREWLDYDLGDGIRFNSEDGPGADGYVNHPFMILRRDYDVESQTVTFTLWDVRDALIASRFEDGLSRLSEITDDDDAAMVVTDDEDLAPLVLL